MASHHDMIHFSVRPMVPFRLDLTIWALRRRSMNAVDAWNGTTYCRVLAIRDQPMLLAVTQRERTPEVTLTARCLPPEAKQSAASTLERLLGIRKDLSEFYEFSSRHTSLHELAVRFRGLKPPRFATVFEALVNGITCQQLSLTLRRGDMYRPVSRTSCLRCVFRIRALGVTYKAGMKNRLSMVESSMPIEVPTECLPSLPTACAKTK